MRTQCKKALRADALAASRALDRVLEAHDLSPLLTFSTTDADTLHKSRLDAKAGLSVLAALLISEIGTDNL